MDLAFYAAAAGAAAHQKRINVVSNNLSNISTAGFKKEDAVFSDLIYNELNPPAQEGTQLTASSGSVIDKTNTDFSQGNLAPSGLPHDYALKGEGFFALQNPISGEITYTRDGTFELSEQADGTFLLVSQNGKRVLDSENQPIVVTNETKEEKQPLGVFRFRTIDGMLHLSNNEFMPTEKNGEAIPVADGALRTLQYYTEESNVNLADEITKMIEAQRAYQYALKMVATTDEIETTINGLRN